MDKYVEVFAASDIMFAYLMKANLENVGKGQVTGLTIVHMVSV